MLHRCWGEVEEVVSVGIRRTVQGPVEYRLLSIKKKFNSSSRQILMLGSHLQPLTVPGGRSPHLALTTGISLPHNPLTVPGRIISQQSFRLTLTVADWNAIVGCAVLAFLMASRTSKA